MSLVMGMHSGAVFSSWDTWKSIQLQGSQELGVLEDFVRYSEVFGRNSLQRGPSVWKQGCKLPEALFIARFPYREFHYNGVRLYHYGNCVWVDILNYQIL